MLKVYGSKISYYTGKLEAYLRYKGLPYERIPSFAHRPAILANTGAMQMPIVERDDGRWMSDTTPILRQLETEYPEPSIFPGSPAVRFIALLIEDYADEWLWRPAMHYRWSYAHDRELLSSIITDELTAHTPLPRFIKRRLIQRRQRGGFVRGDGVCNATWNHVEGGYLTALSAMSRMLEKRSYLLGDSPSVADFGLMGPMLRHFGQDPTPAEIMRSQAPAVWAWTARVWNARPPRNGVSFVESVPEDATPLLAEICETHLVQLGANAEAWARASTKKRPPRRFEMEIQGCHYRNMPVSRYRVACLEKLRQAFSGLGEEEQGQVRSLLDRPGAEILWGADLAVGSGFDEEGLAPFGQAINVYDKGFPR